MPGTSRFGVAQVDLVGGVDLVDEPLARPARIGSTKSTRSTQVHYVHLCATGERFFYLLRRRALRRQNRSPHLAQPNPITISLGVAGQNHGVAVFQE